MTWLRDFSCRALLKRLSLSTRADLQIMVLHCKISTVSSLLFSRKMTWLRDPSDCLSLIDLFLPWPLFAPLHFVSGSPFPVTCSLAKLQKVRKYFWGGISSTISALIFWPDGRYIFRANLWYIHVPFLKKVGQVKYKRVSFQVSAFGARRKKLKGNLAEKLKVDEEAYNLHWPATSVHFLL